jgi:DNA sulfur modification protein DndE
MSIKQVRVSSQAKEQLIRLKIKTGITQWNILCRWAFCASMAEPTPPTPINIQADSNVRMA